MNGMTIKQIAELCNVAESTVRSWARKTAESALISAKIADCQGKEPARLSLPDTLSIIRAGGRETLADLLAQNAGQTPPHGPEALYTPHDMDMLMLGYRRGLQESGKLPPQAATPPALRALPAPVRLQREPITGAVGSTRITLYPDYPITLRGLARLLNVDPAIIRRHSDHLGYPLSGHQERAFTSEHARAIWQSIICSRDASGRKTE